MKDWEIRLNQCDFIFISHNHSDHLNFSTLSSIRKDMLFIVPDFDSDSVAKSLRSQGFNNIIGLKCGFIYNFYGTDLLLSLFQSGDLRDDSGIYFTYHNFSFLSTVDSNNLNNGVLPLNPTVLATSFCWWGIQLPALF